MRFGCNVLGALMPKTSNPSLLFLKKRKIHFFIPSNNLFELKQREFYLFVERLNQAFHKNQNMQTKIQHFFSLRKQKNSRTVVAQS